MKLSENAQVGRRNWIRTSRVLAGLSLGLLILASMPWVLADDPPRMFTNIGQLRELADTNLRTQCPVRLEGIVCAANSEKGLLFLQDDTGVFPLTLNLQGQSIQPGTRVIVTGEGVAEESDLAMGVAPLVDVDGIHGMTERPESGEIYLKAGRYPIRVVWFNGEGDYGLEVYCQGPGLPQQKIPAAALFRKNDATNGDATTWVSGLNYRYFEGADWTRLPDFAHLKEVRSGALANFDTGIIDRNLNVALEFTG